MLVDLQPPSVVHGDGSLAAEAARQSSEAALSGAQLVIASPRRFSQSHRLRSHGGARSWKKLDEEIEEVRRSHPIVSQWLEEVRGEIGGDGYGLVLGCSHLMTCSTNCRTIVN